MRLPDQPLRVVHLGKYYPPAPGGIETHVQTLARAQSILGADVRVVCVNHEDRHHRDVTWLRYGATQTVDERDGRIHVTRLGRSATVARLDICPDLPRVLREVGRACDVIHLHTPNPAMTLGLSAIRPNKPLIITHHSDIVRQRLIRYALMPFEYFVYSCAAKVHSTSPPYSEGSRLLQVFRSKVESLPLGVELDSYCNPSAQAMRYCDSLKEQHKGPIWLAVGRFVYYKNFAVAIKALAHVRGSLILVGQGPLEQELRRLSYAHGVADRVIWKPYVEPHELVGAYHAATALWFPSNARSEAFGMVQVEAMASGCPVINSEIRHSGVSWVSRHEETGLTVPVDDSAALARAAQRLLNEPDLRTRLAAGARKRAREEFDHLSMAARSIRAYYGAIYSGKSWKLPSANGNGDPHNRPIRPVRNEPFPTRNAG